MKMIGKKAMMFCLFLLSFSILASPAFCGIGKQEDGAIVVNSTHVESKVNPNAGDFLWELEGKPEPRRVSPTGEKLRKKELTQL